MWNHACYVCQDDRNFNMLVNQTRNINNQLKRYCMNSFDNDKMDYNLQELRNNLNTVSLHCHFMCGTCLKVNEIELINVEQELNNILIHIASELTEKNHIYFNTLQLLRGRYSQKYHCFEKYCLKKFKED